jgi:hypothetical protein
VVVVVLEKQGEQMGDLKEEMEDKLVLQATQYFMEGVEVGGRMEVEGMVVVEEPVLGVQVALQEQLIQEEEGAVFIVRASIVVEREVQE